MNTLVVNPLSKSIMDYKIMSRKLDKGENRKEHFEYILFREVFISAKIKGSQERLKMAITMEILQ